MSKAEATQPHINESALWTIAEKLRGNMEPSDYMHAALVLIFLKYISDAFEAKCQALAAIEKNLGVLGYGG